MFDAFRYHAPPRNGRSSAPKGGGDGGSDYPISLPEHADPGLVTIEPRATLSGLEVLDLCPDEEGSDDERERLGSRGWWRGSEPRWRLVEPLMAPLPPNLENGKQKCPLDIIGE